MGIISMKSYSDKWRNSKIAISIEVIKKHTVPKEMEINRSLKVDWLNKKKNSSIVFIDGYHEIKTSVHFPHKIPLVNGAKKGDSIIMDVKLISGSEFKIQAITLCSF